jgi:hypothetical protein
MVKKARNNIIMIPQTAVVDISLMWVVLLGDPHSALLALWITAFACQPDDMKLQIR